MQVLHLADGVGILSGRVHNIWHQHLHMDSLSPRWVQRFLSVVQLRDRVTYDKDGVHYFRDINRT